MMYQENRDISTSTIRVPRATKSPCAQSASRPYGFSTTFVAASFSMISSSVQKGRGAPLPVFKTLNRSVTGHPVTSDRLQNFHQSVSTNFTLKLLQNCTGLPFSVAGAQRVFVAYFAAASSRRADPELFS